MKNKNLYYVLKQYHNNKYFINDIEVHADIFNKFTSPKYTQIEYTCYFDKKQNFIRQWVFQEA